MPIGCVPKPFRMLCHSLCIIIYVYEMYVNLMSQLNGVLAVSTWCRWCGLAQCVGIARPVINSRVVSDSATGTFTYYTATRVLRKH